MEVDIYRHGPLQKMKDPVSSLKFGAPRKDPFQSGRAGIFTGIIYLPVVAIEFVLDKVSVAIEFDGDTRFGVKKFIME